MSSISTIDMAYWELKDKGELPFNTLVLLVKPIGKHVQDTRFYGKKEPYNFERYDSSLLKYMIKEYEKMGIKDFAKGDDDIDIYNLIKKEEFKRSLPLLVGGLGAVILIGSIIFKNR